MTRVLPVGLAVLLPILVGISGWSWWSDGDSIDHEVTATARQQAINFFSLDHRTIDEDLDQVVELATGSFKEEYMAERERVKQGVAEHALVVSAEVPDNATAIEYQHGDRARVLVAVDATTEGTKDEAESETNRYRVRMTLERADDRWLVSNIDQVG